MNTTTQTKKLIIGSASAETSAQAMTLIAYGDCKAGQKAGIPFRSLDFKTKCNNFDDFKKCLGIISEYNEFDAREILTSCSNLLNAKRYWNPNNINNGSDLYDFAIAREGSPAFYVTARFFLSPQKLVNGKPIKFTEKDFKADMALVAKFSKADEFSIEDVGMGLEARFWFD